jgi:hypothetical protein
VRWNNIEERWLFMASRRSARRQLCGCRCELVEVRQANGVIN